MARARGSIERLPRAGRQTERPAARVLAVLELLQSRERMTGQELANRIGVDPRTMRRYIRTLEDLGIPIAAERGRHGAYFLVAGYKLPPLMFNDEEGLALAIGSLAVRALGIAPSGPALESAHAKLTRVMPEAIRARLTALAASARIETRPEALQGSSATPVLLALAAGAYGRHRVTLVHRAQAADAPTTRAFDPYALAFRGGRWYTVGYCHLRQAQRSFRVDRILDVAAGCESFEVPRGFDALHALDLSFAQLPRAYAVEILLRTDLVLARQRISPVIGLLEECADGVVLRAQTDDLPWFARQMALWDIEARILAPAKLRRVVRDAAARLLRSADSRPQRATSRARA